MARPNRTTRSAYRTHQDISSVISHWTSLDNTVAPEIQVHFTIPITLAEEKVVVLKQRGDLCAGLAIVDGHDISDIEHLYSICAKD